MGGLGVVAWNQGNEPDYVLGTSEGWDAFGVVRWHGIEELSQPYRYEIILQRPASSGAVDLDTLLDAAASFRIASQGTWRVIHGILAEAEQIDQTSTLILYRVVLVPPFWRARHRRRCRNFLGQSLVDIVSSVLENRSPAHPQGMGGLTPFTSAFAPDQPPNFGSFSPPTGSYRWDVKDNGRCGDRTVRPYVVQYNESDFDFMARLLEDEGLSYYYEHGHDQVVLAITDTPGVSPMFDEDATFTLRRVHSIGSTHQHEIVRSFRDTRRLRSRAVIVRDWDYNRSAAPLEAKEGDPTLDADVAGHFEFPVGEEAVRAQPGQHAATIRKQRYDAERALREGSSTVRTMAPGYRFTLRDHDGTLPDAKLLATRVETFATELTPKGTVLDEDPFGFANAPGPLSAGFDSRFLALANGVPFRPPMRTPRPRIHGVQAAVVTAEEFADGDRPVINGDALGRVRVRFPWDQRPDLNDQTPTSTWLRVSQFWAGAGYGALYTPRVGHEVLVAYMQGDPDQPVIVGRVYNVQHTPPYDAQKEPTKSTVRSQSAEGTTEVDGFNEIRLDDQANKEEIFLHAQRDFNEVVGLNHSTGVTANQSNGVGGNQSNSVTGHREHTVGAYEKVTVGGDRTTLFQANEHHTVSASRDTAIGANDELTVGGWWSVKVAAASTLKVGGNRDVAVAAASTLSVGGNRDVNVGGTYTVKTSVNYVSEAAGNHVFKSTNTYVTPAGDFQVDSTTAGFNQTSRYYVHAGDVIELQAGSAKLTMSSGRIVLDNGAGAQVVLYGGMAGILSGAATVMNAGGPLLIDASGDIKANAPSIKLNG